MAHKKKRRNARGAKRISQIIGGSGSNGLLNNRKASKTNRITKTTRSFMSDQPLIFSWNFSVAVLGFSSSISPVFLQDGVFSLDNNPQLGSLIFNPPTGTVSSLTSAITLTQPVNVSELTEAFIRCGIWTRQENTNNFIPTNIFVDLPKFTGLKPVGTHFTATAHLSNSVDAREEFLLVYSLMFTSNPNVGTGISGIGKATIVFN
ncbi:hypothetical protein IC619_001135 [Hazenella sp. IB182353]|uniref:hypothetical protein n=1 Tax=Polycladospora coralii TaxID=2771432 RepID=UPI0017461F62|nr:hypothetical protein [Polycladospora coralii]MBS7529097.1 hypothetical protein [Polycladospora coralii]